MENLSWITVLVFVVDHALRIGIAVRLIMRRRPVGISLSWLGVILSVPFLGAFAYLLLAEKPLGSSRVARAEAIHSPYLYWLHRLAERYPEGENRLGPAFEPVRRLVRQAVGSPTVPGNALELLPSAASFFEHLVDDIAKAESTCHLEFYIWEEGGRVDQVVEALVAAHGRGVICRVLVDEVGSKEFIRSGALERLRDAGIQAVAALPVGGFRKLFVRIDLRNHRKLVVIDGRVAYTGSQNLVDPALFKQDADVGRWIDAMVRIEGPAVELLQLSFLEDWELETQTGLEELRETGDLHDNAAVGEACLQVIPSGPGPRTESIYRVLLTAVYTARHRIGITTPYFVPDEPLVQALISAALRGVRVELILPTRVDSRLVRYASRAHFEELLRAGVLIYGFDAGLLHTKSVTIDDELCLFGTLNLDQRSFWLNFELTVCSYDASFSDQLRALQQQYRDRSTPVTLDDVYRRGFGGRLLENTARLLSPLL